MTPRSTHIPSNMKKSTLSFIALGCLATQTQAAPALDQWGGTGPFANGQGNRVVTALAVSANGANAYAGTGSGTVLRYVHSNTIPNAFSFAAQAGVAPGVEVTSNGITVTGINTVAGISVTGGTYSINAGAYTAAAGNVHNGDTVTVRQTASASYSTTTIATLTIGGISGGFSVTTQAAPATPVTDPDTTIPPLPVTVTVPGVTVDSAFVNVTVGGGPSFMADLVAMLSAALGQPLRYVEQNALGTVILSGYFGGNLAFVPSNFQGGGDARANGVYAVGDGRYQVVRSGQSLTIAPATVRLDQLTALFPGVGATVGGNGVITARIDAVTHVVQPGAAVRRDASTGPARLTMAADGYWHFIDALGNDQILYPAFADVSALRNALVGLDPNATVAIQLDGTAAILFKGQPYTLVPDLTLGSVPAERAGQYWWQESSLRFRVVNAQPLGTVQGFTVKP